MEQLAAESIESRPAWKPLHLQPVFFAYDFVSETKEGEGRHIVQDEMRADKSVCGQIFEKGLCLPSDTKLKEEDLEYICARISQCWE